jgi:hypothetical protein
VDGYSGFRVSYVINVLETEAAAITANDEWILQLQQKLGETLLLLEYNI